MKMEVIIVYRGALAYYYVVREKADVYSVYLKQYNGLQRPAETITLAKSIRHWTGSIDDLELINDIGSAIERQQHTDPLFPRRGERQQTMDNIG